VAPPVNGRGAREDAKIMVSRPLQFPVKGGCVNSSAAQAKELGQPLETHVIACRTNVVKQYRFRLYWCYRVERRGISARADEALS